MIHDQCTRTSERRWHGCSDALLATWAERWGRACRLAAYAEDLAKRLGLNETEADRIAHLLARGGSIALELEHLAGSGIWCLTRADDAYPLRLRNRLKHQAPPVLFGAGELEILKKPAIAIVGSRNLDESGESFAKSLSALCAQHSVAVVSGGARGTDRIAMLAALEAGGCAAGILADSLSADYAVVVSSAYQKGGTWAGAVEALTAGWCPVFVRSGADVGSGNRELVSRGAIPISDEELDHVGNIMEWMKKHAGLRLKQAELLPA